VTLSALIGRSFGRASGLVASLSIVLMTFQVMVVLAATYLRETEGFSQLIGALPAFVQQMTGPIFASFGSMAAFGFFHPVVVIVFVGTAIVVASEPAADVESGLVDLILARPVARWQLVARSLAMMVLTTTGMVTLMVMASRVSMMVLAPPGTALSLGILGKLASNLAAVAWVLGTVSLAAAAIVRRRSAAAGGAAIIALALYLLNLLAEIWPRVQPYGRLSPFHYYQATLIITGTANRWASDIAALAGAAAVLSVVAFVAFARRDV
jgi:beta-exotoxin I transport system permease protein